jgi:quinol monooxygenase YgiN
MKARIKTILVTALFIVLFSVPYGIAQNIQVIQLAKLRIDSTRLESYKAALKEEIETSVRIEPGVLSLYAVSEKDNPTHITIFEIYANKEAYNAHRESPHFKKYKNSTKDMVKSLELIEVVPITLGTKAGN